MLKESNQILEELDKTLEELEQLVEQERIKNEIMNARILEKEIFLNNLEAEYRNY